MALRCAPVAPLGGAADGCLFLPGSILNIWNPRDPRLANAKGNSVLSPGSNVLLSLLCAGASGGSYHCLPDIIYGEESDKVSHTPFTHNIYPCLHAFLSL